MGRFQYEWWTVNITFENGTYTCEYKGKTKYHIIRQIEKEIAYTNSEANLNKNIYVRKARILSVDWASLKLDRVGYQRLY